MKAIFFFDGKQLNPITKKPLKVYIAGKINGDPNYRYKFKCFEEVLAEDGLIVLNPAWMPAGMEQQDYMMLCFTMIDTADKVYFMPDADESAGARLEKAYCEYIGKPYQSVTRGEF